jgi:hypothetical protein
MELPREVVIEPLELGTPDAYVAQGASRVYSTGVGVPRGNNA